MTGGEARLVTINVDDSGLFHPISEIRNKNMTEILSMHSTVIKYDFDVCGYTLVNGTKRASITKYDALRNAYVEVSNSSEFSSVCRGVAPTIPYSKSLYSFFLTPI